MALQLRRGTNAERLLITPQQGELIFVTDYLAVNITATTIASNLITFSTNHNLTVGQKLLFVGITANGLIQNTVYYVLADGLTTTACKLSLTSAGAPVTLTNATGLTALFNKSPTNASGTPVSNVSPLWVGNGTTVGGVAAQTSVLDDLLDVTILNVAEGQTLYYDANTAQWKNTDILKINDATTGVEIYNTAGTRTRRTGTFTNQPQTVLTVSSASTGTPTAGFGSSIALENEVRPDIYQVGAFITSSLTDVTAGSEDAKLTFQIQTAGGITTPLLLEGYDASVSGNLYLKGDNTANTWVDFVHPSKTARLEWDGSNLSVNGNINVAGTGSSVISANTSVTNAPVAPLILRHTSTGTPVGGFGTTIGFEAETTFSGVKTIGYLDYQVSDNSVNSEDYTFGIGLMKNGVSPSSTLLRPLTLTSTGDLTIEGNMTLKASSTDDTWVDFVHPTKTGHLAWQGSGLFINGDFDVAGTGQNGTANITAGLTTIPMSIANIFNNTGIGTVNIGYGASSEVNIGGLTAGTRTQIKSPKTELLGTLKVGGGVITFPALGGDIKRDDMTSLTIQSTGGVMVQTDLTVNINAAVNGGNITTTATTGNLFNSPTIVNLANAATALTMGATTGTTTIRNNATVTGDVTVNGGNINLNGTATTASQPFLTFQTQAQGANSPYGVRGKSALDDAWFIGSGSTGTDSGYLEIATGDNVGGSNPTYSGGQIYVRQYSGADLGGVPWEGGNGVVVNELTLLDNIGNTSIPNNLTVGNDIAVNGTGGLWADITTTKSQAQLFPENATIVNLATASTALTLGATSGSTTVRNNLTVTGNLTVNGTTTTVNSTTLTVDDKNIELGSVDIPSNSTATGGGITLLGGSDGNKTIIWNNATDGWDFNQNISGSGTLALDGSTITLRASQTGTPNSANTTSIVVERGDATNSALTFYEADDTWYFTNNAKIESDFTVIGNELVGGNLTVNGNGTIGNVYIGKNALNDSQGYRVSVAKGNDLTLQSGNTLTLNSDVTALKRNTSKASSIITNLIGNWANSYHQFTIGDRIQYTGATGNGLTQNNFYYVSDVGFTTTTIRLANTFGGTPITLTAGSNLTLTFFSEGGINNAYFNVNAGQYAFNKETTSGNYNLEVAGSFNATTNAVIGGDIEVNSGNINTLSEIGSVFNYDVPTVYIGGGATYVGIGGGGNTVINADLTVNGNVIKANGGTTALTLTPTTGDVAVTGALKLTGNKINASNGTTAVETTTTGDIIVGDDVFARGNAIQFNYGTTGTPTLGAAVQVERGDLTNVEFGWSEISDRWIFTNDGTNFTTLPVATDTPTYAGLTISNNTTSNLIGITGTVANTANDGDAWFVGGYSINGETNNGAMVLATANNGNEPIYVRQYTGSSFTNVGSNTINRELTLLDSSGNTVLANNLQVTGNTIKKSGGTDVITFSGTNLTTLAGGAVVTADLAVNGGDITTSATTANLFTTATTVNIGGGGGATVNYSGLVTHSNVITDLAATTTLTQTTAHNLTSTTRRGMKLLINIIDNVTKDVHIIEVLLITKVVDGVGTVYMTTFGEVTSAGQLATFSADSNGTTTYFYVTPTTNNSTTFAYTRRSI